MQLHHSIADFRDTVEATAQYLGMRPIIVEKDYWVTYVLNHLTTSEYGSMVVFKGGTSLSKAYHCIERFSEDIDLAILPQPGAAGHSIKKLLKTISQAITEGLMYLPGHPSETKFGQIRRTAYAYPSVLSETNFGVLKDHVLVELNAFTHPVPFEIKGIETFIARFLRETGSGQWIAETKLQSFPIQVLTRERTFFEKLLSVNRISYEGIDALAPKVRHFYDMYQLLHQPDIQQTILSPASFEIIQLALQDELANATMSGDWVGKPMGASPLFSHLESVWRELAPVYTGTLNELAWSGRVPSPSDILSALKAIRDFLETYDAAVSQRMA